jgi:FtsH-binding integral membrane protein
LNLFCYKNTKNCKKIDKIMNDIYITMAWTHVQAMGVTPVTAAAIFASLRPAFSWLLLVLLFSCVWLLQRPHTVCAACLQMVWIAFVLLRFLSPALTHTATNLNFEPLCACRLCATAATLRLPFTWTPTRSPDFVLSCAWLLLL